MTYTVYLKVILRNGRPIWIKREKEFDSPPEIGLNVEIYSQGGKRIAVPMRYKPKDYPSIVELREVVPGIALIKFLELLNGSTRFTMWSKEDCPIHVYARALDKEYQEVYRTNSIRARIHYAEGLGRRFGNMSATVLDLAKV